MAQFVVWIQTAENGLGVGWLAMIFEVTPEYPIPTDIPANIDQVVMTNRESYDSIVEVYNEHTTHAIFSYDEPGAKIDCTGAYTGSWPID